MKMEAAFEEDFIVRWRCSQKWDINGVFV